MNNNQIRETFSKLATPLIADACVRLDLPVRIAPPGNQPVIPGSRLAGRVIPVRHYGSVDVFFEAMTDAREGDILVIDNEGRTDEGCIGDLTALEVRACGMAGIFVWGSHRDTAELIEIGLPVFSYGTCPAGPLRVDPRSPEALKSANIGDLNVTNDEMIFADSDGVLFAPLEQAEALLSTAAEIWETERKQAAMIKSGNTLRQQLQFDDYLAKRDSDPDYTFRKHLRAIGGAIEE